jgi:hypothetical protein
MAMAQGSVAARVALSPDGVWPIWQSRLLVRKKRTATLNDLYANLPCPNRCKR